MQGELFGEGALHVILRGMSQGASADLEHTHRPQLQTCMYSTSPFDRRDCVHSGCVAGDCVFTKSMVFFLFVSFKVCSTKVSQRPLQSSGSSAGQETLDGSVLGDAESPPETERREGGGEGESGRERERERERERGR